MNPSRSNLLLPSAVEAIGQTPLVELARLTRGLPGRIVAKLEFLNPGFSKKDRIARRMIEEAEATGALKPGQTVVELTSGNTGTGLAIVCGVKGYPFVAVMSKGNSVERARMMRALGAEVVLVDQLPGSVPGQVSGGDLERVEQETRRIVRERGAFRADQFNLPGQLPRPFPWHRPGNPGPNGRPNGCFLRFRRAPLVHSPAVPRLSRPTTLPSAAIWLSRLARQSWLAEPVTIPTTRFKAGVM